MSTVPDEMLSVLSEDGEGSTLRGTCEELLTKNQFVDVTLSCLDGQIQAHRLVLCSVSGYLYELFTANPTMNPCTHPMVILRDCKVAEVQLALQYIYAGKTMVPRSKLGALLIAAKELGCESLERAVNKAPESTRVTPTPTPPKPIPQLLTPSTPSGGGGGGGKSLLSQITKAISIKTERVDNETQKYSTRKRSTSPTPSPNSSKTDIPPMPKLFRMASSASNGNPSHARSSNAARASESPSPPILHKITQNSQSRSFEGADDRLQLQHDKAESFVYTNENLNMMVFGDEEDEDPNESDDTEAEGSRDFQNKTGWSEDAAADEKPSTCPWCNQLFDNVALLQRHVKTHIGNTTSKPYICRYCSHEFARSAHLKRHVRTHTGEKPYKCNLCDKEFSRQDKMKTHVSRHLQGNLPTLNSNNSSSNNDSLVRTCYPPAAMSQNSGGQVPIKILIPTNSHGSMTSTSRSTTNNGSPDPMESSSLSPTTFFNDRLTPSITINATPPKQTPTNRQPKRPTTQLNSVA